MIPRSPSCPRRWQPWTLTISWDYQRLRFYVKQVVEGANRTECCVMTTRIFNGVWRNFVIQYLISTGIIYFSCTGWEKKERWGKGKANQYPRMFLFNNHNKWIGKVQSGALLIRGTCHAEWMISHLEWGRWMFMGRGSQAQGSLEVLFRVVDCYPFQLVGFW